MKGSLRGGALRAKSLRCDGVLGHWLMYCTILGGKVKYDVSRAMCAHMEKAYKVECAGRGGGSCPTMLDGCQRVGAVSRPVYLIVDEDQTKTRGKSL